MKRAILSAVQSRDSTPREIAESLGLSRVSVSARLHEFFMLGYLVREPVRNGGVGKPEFRYGVRHGL